MAATFEYNEDNGPATGSPAQGTTRTTNVTNCNWKNIDDATSSYGLYPIVAGSNSYEKFQFGKFTGTFNQISSGIWAHTSNSFATGVSLYGVVTSTYTTPSTATNSALTVNMTTPTVITAGQAVLFSTIGPQDASPTTSITSAGYTQYLVTQLRTSTLASGGDTTTAYLTLQYNEN